MSIKGEKIGGQPWEEGTLERGYLASEKNRRSGHLLSEEHGGKLQHCGYFEEESYNISVFGGHHRHTQSISGGDSEVSRLNFFYLQFIFIFFICVFSFRIIFYFLGYEDCIAWVWLIKETHDFC